MEKRSWLAFAAALMMGAAVFALDLATKHVLFPIGDTSDLIPKNSIITLVTHRNYGISFNLPIPLPVTILITGLALGWALALLIERGRADNRLACIVIGIFIGGVLGNVFDRLTLGFVRDWLLLFGRSAINLADLAIAVSLLTYLFFGNRKKNAAEPS
jgi:signal peptidase II